MSGVATVAYIMSVEKKSLLLARQMFFFFISGNLR